MPPVSRVGDVLAGKYRLDAELGRGGMGAVYRAFHLGVHRTFAVKLLLVELAQHKRIADRFLREAQAAGRIGHPGILEVYDVGEDRDGHPFMVMELLSGEPLSALVSRGALDPDSACWIAARLLDVLEAAHGAGVVHRDVKPQNVFLVGQGAGPRAVKLLDFGIAKFLDGDGAAITRSGEIIGSPLYMAPEQARGDGDVDARADVWSVGAMLFEMLTGRPAHTASTAMGVLARILTEPAPAPSTRVAGLPAGLDDIVLRSLAIDRASRFATAAEMRAALEDLRAREGRGERTPIFEPPPRAEHVVRSDADASGDEETAAVTSTGAPGDLSLGAALSNVGQGTGSTAVAHRRRSVVAVAAVALLAGAAAVPWLIPEWRGAGAGSTGSSSSARRFAPIVAEAGIPTRSDVASAESVPSATSATSATSPGHREPGDASTIAPATALAGSAGVSARDAGTERAPAAPPRPSGAPSALVPAVPSAIAAASAQASAAPAAPPVCGPGEVLSDGHCCARGLVWRSGRCERPLATTF